MKQSIKLGLVASALMAITGTVSAQMKDIVVVDTKESPYVIDARGVVVRDPFGLCWRTGSWSVDRAAKAAIQGAPYPNWTLGCECDKDLMPKPVCEPPSQGLHECRHQPIHPAETVEQAKRGHGRAKAQHKGLPNDIVRAIMRAAQE